MGARRIQSELKRLHDISLSVASIHKVFCHHLVKPLVTYRRKSDFTHYQRPISGERVQMDPAKLLTACINIPPWTTVPVIVSCGSMPAGLRTIPWISLIASLRKYPFPFNAYRRIAAVSFLPLSSKSA